MISEGLYDTENWSNDAENSDFPSQEYILKYITIEKLFWKSQVYGIILDLNVRWI